MGCNKTDIFRWRQQPYSTQKTVRQHKLLVIAKAGEIFELSARQTEFLANTAGLSLYPNGRPQTELLPRLLRQCGRRQRRLLYHAAVSERMLQYYLAGRQPSKQALLAILLLLEAEDLPASLNAYGYCLSASLANDAVVRWHLANAGRQGAPADLLLHINHTLDELGLPLLMTKQFK